MTTTQSCVGLHYEPGRNVNIKGLARLMEYKKGQRVTHPQVPDWGLGEVLEDRSGDLVRVFFVGAGEKILSLKDFELTKVDGDEAKHPILDNLKISDDKSLKYRTLPECVQRFLIDYPGGFYGQKFADEERDYKLKAHLEMRESLNQDIFTELIANGHYEELYNRATKHVGATNHIHLQEKLALRNGLGTSEVKQTFAEALYSYLFGDALFEKRFNEFANFLEGIKAGKWTIITFFSSTMFPDRDMFIKPTITNNAADICGFDIRYRPELNWATYEAVLKFSAFLKQSISEMRPRDMIDVQSFMWCIRPDKAAATHGKKKSKQAGRHE